MMLRSSLNECITLKDGGWSDWSGVVGGLSLCASARGPSGLRVRPIKTSWVEVHSLRPCRTLLFFRPQEKVKIHAFLSLWPGSTDALENFFYVSFLHFLQQNGKLSKHGKNIISLLFWPGADDAVGCSDSFNELCKT